jgi:hypothetical protein
MLDHVHLQKYVRLIFEFFEVSPVLKRKVLKVFLDIIQEVMVNHNVSQRLGPV